MFSCSKIAFGVLWSVLGDLREFDLKVRNFYNYPAHRVFVRVPK